MPPRAKKKHQKKKKKKDAGRSHAQTSTAPVVDVSVEVPEDDGAENITDNDEDGISPKTPVKFREGGESKYADTEAISEPIRDKDHAEPTVNVSEDENGSAKESVAFVRKEGNDLGLNRFSEGVVDHSSSETPRIPGTEGSVISHASEHRDDAASVRNSTAISKSSGKEMNSVQVAASCSVSDATAGNSGEQGKVLHDSPIKAAGLFDPANAKQQWVDTQNPVDRPEDAVSSLDVDIRECPAKVSDLSDGEESKIDDASCVAVVDVNESVQSLSSVETPKSLQSPRSQPDRADFPSEELEISLSSSGSLEPVSESHGQVQLGKDGSKNYEKVSERPASGLKDSNKTSVSSVSTDKLIVKVSGVSADEIERQESDLKGKPNMDLQRNKEIFDDHAEDDATSMTTGPSTVMEVKTELRNLQVENDVSVTEVAAEVFTANDKHTNEYNTPISEEIAKTVNEEKSIRELPLRSEGREDETPIRREEKTSWMSCCGVFEILRIFRS
eukprot:TRINITY_DN763_c0_g1_i2.p1 TRINITY_DN763_c0_g1~~TRINITY_DN763_c0_g1_i2.p1  ORF type:complete len:501 (+),score=129.76 TRINITY_DN763_c0_g1_i2:248-1750(+)